jgi:hypothetical protein
VYACHMSYREGQRQRFSQLQHCEHLWHGGMSSGEGHLRAVNQLLGAYWR